MIIRNFIFGASLLLSLALQAAMPQVLNHQGRLAVNGVNFDGSGQFKFALVNSDGSTTYWSNDGTGSAGLQPTAAVTLTVSKGLYAVLLGDTALSNMTAVPTSVFDHTDVRLRVWFNDGSHGFQLMTPDQRLAASPYAMVADKATRSASFDGSLAGEVTGTQDATAIAATTVTSKDLTGFVSGAGTIAATDSILSAINKLDGNNKLMAPLASPSFTGTVDGITAAMVGLGNVSNTSDANKPVSTAQQAALDLKAPLASPTFTGTVSGSFSGPLAGNAATASSATNFSGSLSGDVTGTQGATAIAATTVTGKLLTGYVSGAGTITATDSILSAIRKLNGNDGLKANLASPTFTGTVGGITASMVGLGSVNNTSDANKPVSSAQQTALDLKANLSNPTFTGTVSGITASMVGLGNVTNTSDADKPVSSAQQAALNLKSNSDSPTFTGTVSGITASMVGLGNVTNTSDVNKPVSTAQQTALDQKSPLASPSFTGTVSLPAGTISVAPLKLATGVNLTSAVFGSVEFDGTHLYLTNNSASPTRKTIAFTDSALAAGAVGSSQLASGLTLGGTTTGTFSGPLTGNVTGNVSGSAASFTGSLAGDVTGTQGATSISAGTVTGKVLTGYVSGAGTIAATDTILSAINKLNGNDGLKANIASPTFTGTVTSPAFSGPLTGNVTGNVTGSAGSFTGLLAGDVTGTQGATAISAATVTGKALTGYLSGAGVLSAADTILSAINKLNGNDGLKAPTASPAFTGIPSAPTALAATNTTQVATTEFVQSAIQNVVGAAPAALDTLSELATALNNDQSYASTITNALALKAPIANPIFTGTVAGITPTMVGLGDVNNTSDANKPVSTAQQTALDLKANLASPTFTGTVSGITKAMVGLSNVTNTSDANKPVSTAQQTALDLKSNLASPTFTGTVTLPTGTASVAPLKLATGVNLTTVVFGAVEFDGNSLYLTNNSATPTRKTIAFTDSALATGTVGSSQLASGLTLGGTTTGTFSGPLAGNVTGNVTGSAASFTGSLAGDVTGTQSATAISAATVTGKLITGYVSGSGVVSAADTILSAINKLNGNDGLKANLASPTFTGTVSGITATMVGLGNVNDTSDASKPVSTLQQTALDLKAPLASPTFTGTVSGITATMVGLGNVNDTSDASKPVSTLQQAALDLKAPLASPTFTGSVSGITKAMVGLSNVTNTNDVNKPVSTFQQAALDLKANLASPTFTGTVSGITATMVGLGNVTNTSDANKPVSTAQQTALSLKANLASPTFSGTVSLPAGTSLVAPLKLATGTSLTTAVFGSVEFDGTNLYLTNNSASPTRKTLAFTDSIIASVPLTSLTAAPLKPVVAWGNNHDGQTTLPSLANVAAVAAGDSHSLVLLDDGTVVAWGLNISGQTTIPSGLTGVTEIAACASHNLVRKSDGTLVAWGDNSYGQNTIPSGITTATKVAAGEKHSLALLANGTVRAWGDNGFSQTTLPGGLTGATITAIAAGYDHCLALKSDGTVIAWGRDDAGQVTLPSGLSNVVGIAAGAYHSLALKGDGTVVAWGWDGGGQVTVPTSLSGITKIAGGYAFSMALKSDGTLVLWGDNSDGQTIVPSTATQVTHIAAGASHALALRSDAIAAQVARLDQDNVFTGKVGIKRTAATNSLEVEGAASKTTAGSWLANSDRRIKTEIQSITGALEKLDRVHLVDFRYTDEYRAAHPSIEDVRYPNVIAQEFAEVFPDDVKSSGELMSDGSPILQVDTYPLTIYSAAAVQELHRENQELKKKIADQERRLRRLEDALENK